MKIHVLSDLHIEFGPYVDGDVERDLTILSGDIAVGYDAYDLVQELKKKSPVVYIPGNHEYYSRIPMDELDSTLDQSLGQEWLQNKVRTVDGLKIAGCTLWTDFSKGAESALDAAQYGMNDFNYIRTGHSHSANVKKFTSRKACDLHKRMKDWLWEVKPDIVVTHHAPSMRSINPLYEGHNLNPAYASDMEEFVKELGAKLWTHGHVHSSSDYTIGTTRIVVNPRGYVGYESNPKFNPNHLIEI